MPIFKHELRQGRLSLIIWTASISFMIAICVFIFPDMSADMSTIGKLFSNMGSFSAAFGMDKINFGEFIGFFGIECGNILGLGGAFFAALTGISILSKEERDHTAEFLFVHPLSRVQIIYQKLLSVIAQITILNMVTILVTIISIIAIKETAPLNLMMLLFFAYFVMQLEITSITFCLSAFLTRNGLGMGLGLATIFYFLNLMSNLSKKAQFLKYFTPFGYTDGADIIGNSAINLKYLLIGIVVSILCIVIGFIKYSRKDII